MTACRCTHEQGDTDCERHPCCPDCGESVESMRLVHDYRAIDAALNAANVPTRDVREEGNGTIVRHLSLAERIALLVSQRDEARKLAADAAHQLANERQVVADLRERNCAACTTERLDYEKRSAKLAKYERVVEAARAWRNKRGPGQSGSLTERLEQTIAALDAEEE